MTGTRPASGFARTDGTLLTIGVGAMLYIATILTLFVVVELMHAKCF